MTQFRITEVSDLQKTFRDGIEGLSFRVQNSTGYGERFSFYPITHGSTWREIAKSVHDDFLGIEFYDTNPD